MNVRLLLHGIDFEWDSKKASDNLAKHGVTFEDACQVFFDPFLQSVDERGVSGERREAVVGMTEDWHMLYVVYIDRDQSVRLISARPVTAHERKTYETQ